MRYISYFIQQKALHFVSLRLLGLRYPLWHVSGITFVFVANTEIIEALSDENVTTTTSEGT